MKIIFLLLIICNLCSSAQPSAMHYVFKNNKEGYNVYRIPTIIGTKSGKLLAFCEGRKSLRDHGNIDLVMKTSLDNGETWSSLKVLWNDGSNTCGNPSPVMERVSGDIIVAATLNNEKVYVLRSKDEGNTWEQPQEITADVKPGNWKWYATGPVHAIQLEQAQYKNRIVVPCNHTLAGVDKHISHVIYSDDNGTSWKLGGNVPSEKTDECTVVELTNGNLLLNMRNNDRTMPNRKISLSVNGGHTWTSAVFDSTLIEPVCQGSLLRYSVNPDVLLFSNPLHKKKRKKLTLSVSYDEGKLWKKQVTIHKKKSAYNDIVVLSNGDVLCLFETGRILPYSGIATKTIPAEFLKK